LILPRYDRNWWKIPSDQRDQRISSSYDFDQFFPVGTLDWDSL
jgi:hypothetical protein